MPQTQTEVISQVENGLQKLAKGEMSEAEFSKFMQKSNQELETLAQAKAQKAWEDFNWKYPLAH